MNQRFYTVLLVFGLVSIGELASAQLTAPRSLSGSSRPIGQLEEQLINGLRATRVEQQAFLKKVVTLTSQKKLDQRLVTAIYGWSRRRQPLYPFPFFERGIRIEAQKRGIVLPPVATINRSGTLSAAPRLPLR